MRWKLLVLLCMPWLVGPAAARPTVQDCFGCVLGIYGDSTMTRIRGEIASGVPLNLYLGIKFDPIGGIDGLTSVECAIAGLGGQIQLIGFELLIPATVLGNPLAPPDTSSSSTSTGGMNIAWAHCLAGSQALAKLTILAPETPSGGILRVKHRYPPTNESWRTPVITLCGGPTFTAVRVWTSDYCLNGAICGDGVEERSWGTIKQLYR